LRLPYPTAAIAVIGVGAVSSITALIALWTSHEHALGIQATAANPLVALDDLEAAQLRLDARSWLAVRRDFAAACSARLRDPRSVAPAIDLQRAVEAWGEVFRRCPGMPDAGARLAGLLSMQGDDAAAMKVVRQTLNQIDPFDTYCNIRMARTRSDLMAQIDDACRAICDGQIEGEVDAFLTEIKPQLDQSQQWQSRVRIAWRDAQQPVDQWKEPMAPETLRIESWRLARSGQLAAARDMANGAAYTTAR